MRMMTMEKTMTSKTSQTDTVPESVAIVSKNIFLQSIAQQVRPKPYHSSKTFLVILRSHRDTYSSLLFQKVSLSLRPVRYVTLVQEIGIQAFVHESTSTSPSPDG